MEGDDLAGGGELHVPAVGGPAAHLHGDGLADRVLHLGGDGAHPDQLVQPEVVAGQAGLGRGAEALAGRADGLVRLLGVLHLGGVGAGRVRQVVGAVELGDLRPGGVDRGLRQRGGVGTHVGDEAVLVQLLGHLHGPLGTEAQLAAGLLLERGGAERRVRRAAVRLGLDAAHRERGLLQGGGQRAGGLLVQVQGVGAARLEPAVLAEVAAAGDPLAVDGGQPGAEVLRVGGVGRGAAGAEGADQVPVRGRAERDPLPLALDDQPGRHGLHAARRQLRHDLLPEHRRDLEAVQAVEDAAGFLGVDQALVQLARVGHGLLDGGLGDLVEHHPVHRHLGLEHLLEVPRDGLALAVLIGGEEELVGLREERLQLADLGLLVRVHHVDRGEVVVDVHPEAAHLTGVLVRDLGGRAREVPNVSDARLDDVAGAKVALDRLRLGRRLDNDESLSVRGLAARGHLRSSLPVVM